MHPKYNSHVPMFISKGDMFTMGHMFITKGDMFIMDPCSLLRGYEIT